MSRRKATLYSRSAHPPSRKPPYSESPPQESSPAVEKPARFKALRSFLRRHERPLLAACGLLAGLALYATHMMLLPQPQQLTQQDIDKAVRHSLETKGIPSQGAKAYEIVRPSVVRVRRLVDAPTSKGAREPDASAGAGAPEANAKD